MFGCQYKIVSKIPLDIDVKKNSSACGGQPPTLRQHTTKNPPCPLAKMLGNRSGLLVKARVGFGPQPEGPGFESLRCPFW